jgi:hypothetical protein
VGRLSAGRELLRRVVVRNAGKHRLPIAGGRQMEYSDYLRDQAAEYRRLADQSEDPIEKEDLFESAAIYEMVANDLEDRRLAG